MRPSGSVGDPREVASAIGVIKCRGPRPGERLMRSGDRLKGPVGVAVKVSHIVQSVGHAREIASLVMAQLSAVTLRIGYFCDQETVQRKLTAHAT
jgi:hypothetical protein